jgi:hypothetical protein
MKQAPSTSAGHHSSVRTRRFKPYDRARGQNSSTFQSNQQKVKLALGRVPFLGRLPASKNNNPYGRQYQQQGQKKATLARRPFYHRK